MDKLFNTAKDLLQDDKKEQKPQQAQTQTQKAQQQQQQSQPKQQQQQQQQQPLAGGNKAAGGAYPPAGGDDDDLRSAADEAARQAGSSGDKDLFSSIIGSLGQKKAGQQGGDDFDENDVLSKYKTFFGNSNDAPAAGANQKADDKSLGAAAAMHAMKLFNSGETTQKNTQGGFLALAMAEASKLFDDKAKKGQVAEGTSKQGVIQQAGEYAMKMYFKSQGGGAGGAGGAAGGAGGSGGAGGLVDMASKFLK